MNESNVDVSRNRRGSLASQMKEMNINDAFERNIKHNSPQVSMCRSILCKPMRKRTLEDIYVLKTLLASSKLLRFFANLDAFKLDRLYQSLEFIAYAEKGTFVFHEGDDGDNFFLVFSGQVEVMKKDMVNSAQLNHLAYMIPGDTFGEKALMSTTDVRTASVITSSESTELVVINREVFSDLLKESHNSSIPHTLEVAKRFRSNKDLVRNIFMRSAAQRSDKELKIAVEYLNSVKFFSRFSFEVRKQLCKVLHLISAVTNTVIFSEGQVGRHFYIIFTGCTDVSVHTKNRFDETKEIVVSRLGEGDYFGELALSQVDGIRRATVVCTEFCELLILGRDDYEPLIQKYQNEYHAQYAQMLKRNPYFRGSEWDDITIEGMCSVMTEKYIPCNGEICKQGSRASELFIVRRGECRLIHEGKNPVTNARQIYELGRFGPNSVLGCADRKINDIFVREYSILAESPMKILVLSRFDIFHLMSAEARESLQRFSLGYARESIRSRALKTVAWEITKKLLLPVL
ncbi:putative cyclic nucleotide-binding domain-containing protein [Plasmopara halstedii]